MFNCNDNDRKIWFDFYNIEWSNWLKNNVEKFEFEKFRFEKLKFAWLNFEFL